MPLKIIRNDITKVQADAIVNTANPHPVIGRGTDSAVYEAAGRELLLEERKKIGDIAEGNAAITPAFHLDAKYIIHTVSPVWYDGNRLETYLLSSCYTQSLELALNHGCESIAFPLLAAGSNAFPNDIALKTALDTIQDFLMDHEMDVYLVVLDRSAYELSSRIFHDVASYIEEHQAAQVFAKEYASSWRDEMENTQDLRPAAPSAAKRPEPGSHEKKQSALQIRPAKKPSKPSFSDWMESVRLPKKEQTFQVRLLKLIDESGETDPQIYKRANIDRKLFAKIRKDENYRPSRKTVIALALALRLSMDDAVDLLSRAGFALSPASTFDLIIRYCFEHRVYNIIEVNSILFGFDQETL